MKTFLALILMLATGMPSWAAQTWPASTNANQTFFGSNTFAKPITLQTVTASTVLNADAGKHPVSIPNGSGVLTNDGAGGFGWLPYAPAFSLPNGTGVLTNDGSGNLGWVLPIDIEFTGAGVSTNLVGGLLVVTIPGNAADILTLSNNLTSTINSTSNSILSQLTNTINSTSNAILSQLTNTINSTSNAILSQVTNTVNSTSNAILSQVTNTVNTLSNSIISQVSTNSIFTNNTVLVEQIDYLTNSCTMAPDFSKGYCWISTNAAFTFLLPLNIDPTGKRAQTTVQIVTNSSGTAIAATAPANVHVVPGSVMYVTNATSFTWFLYPLIGTNVYAVPLF